MFMPVLCLFGVALVLMTQVEANCQGNITSGYGFSVSAYAKFNANSDGDCCGICDGDPYCAAWTYNPNDPPACHLHASNSDLTKRDGASCAPRYVAPGACWASKPPLRPASNAPNVLYILGDDIGWNDVDWVSNNTLVATPNLRALLEDGGIELLNHYGGPECTPSRAALMSSRYPSHVGLQHHVLGGYNPNGPDHLPLEIWTLADHMTSIGYESHAIGKWHLGQSQWRDTPIERGFQSYLGYLGGAEDYYTHDSGTYDFVDGETEALQYKGNYSSIVFADQAIQLIQNYSLARQGLSISNRGAGVGVDISQPIIHVSEDGAVQASSPSEGAQGGPFFIYLAFQASHSPIEAPPQDDEFFALYPQIKNLYPLSGDRDTHIAIVAYMDYQVGKVLDMLRSTGLYESTVIIFASDNGGEVETTGNNWPLRGGKHTLWQGGVRNVAFIRDGRTASSKPKTQFSGLMHQVDWLPTLFTMAGASLLNDSYFLPRDGISQWDALMNNASPPRNEVLLNLDPMTTDSWFGGYAGLIWGEMKLLLGNPGTPNGWCGFQEGSGPDPEPQNSTYNGTLYCAQQKGPFPCPGPTCAHTGHLLYNLTSDPEEKFDISAMFPSLVEDMTSRLMQFNLTVVCQMYQTCNGDCTPHYVSGLDIPPISDETTYCTQLLPCPEFN